MEFENVSLILPLVGGILIAISATIMLAMLGRITGISGIVSATISKPSREHDWRYAFIAGLISGGFILGRIYPSLFIYSLETPFLKIVVAGLLVGIGTSLGSGCTSGHGVCGLPRFSKRSWVATITFMVAGILTVFVMGKL